MSECSKVRFDALRQGLSCTVDAIAVVLSTNAIVRAVHCDLHSCLVGIMLRGASALRDCYGFSEAWWIPQQIGRDALG